MKPLPLNAQFRQAIVREIRAAAHGLESLVEGTPSPLEVVLGLCEAFAAHCAYARAEQEKFQQHLQDLGISRVSRMTTAEVFESYRMSA